MNKPMKNLKTENSFGYKCRLHKILFKKRKITINLNTKPPNVQNDDVGISHVQLDDAPFLGICKLYIWSGGPRLLLSE